jgi:hypothetical protein
LGLCASVVVAPVLPEADGAGVEVLGVGEDASYGLTGVELEGRSACCQVACARIGAAAVVTDDGGQGEEGDRRVRLGGGVGAGDKVRDRDRAAFGVGEGTDDVLTGVRTAEYFVLVGLPLRYSF